MFLFNYGGDLCIHLYQLGTTCVSVCIKPEKLPLTVVEKNIRGRQSAHKVYLIAQNTLNFKSVLLKCDGINCIIV